MKPIIDPFCFNRNKNYLLCLFLLMTWIMPVIVEAASGDNKLYEFNSGFIVGNKEDIDLNRFNISAITEGTYSVDVYTNHIWKGRYDLTFIRNNDGQLKICYTTEMLSNFGILAHKLNVNLSQSKYYCGHLNEWNDDPNIEEIFNSSALRLDISVPQIYEQHQTDNYIAPKFWNSGEPALNIAYMANYYNSTSSGQNNSDAYLSLNAGLSAGGGLLKHQGNLNWRQNSPARWDSNQTYLQYPVLTLKSKLMVGQFHTTGYGFDSIGLRGVKLETDDNMSPDGVMSYAPEIRGVAQTNALVMVHQGDSLIYQTTVSPGPFVLTDVYPLGYGNQLDVTIKEADGTISTFNVPYASLPQLSRPGMFRYQIAVGKSDTDGLHYNPYVFQSVLQRGMNNQFTGYAGITSTRHYQAYLLGTGINTGIGALSFDVTQSRTAFERTSHTGRSYRMNFSRQIADTKTHLTLSAYRHANKNYHSLNEALYAINTEKHNRHHLAMKNEKSSVNFTLNQELPQNFGGVWFTGRFINRWENVRTEKQYQLNYHNTYDRLSWTLSLKRVDVNGSQDDRIALNMSFPLNFSHNSYTTVTSNTVFNRSQFDSTQLGVNGAFDTENNWTYSISGAAAQDGHHNIAMNTAYRSAYTIVNANYGQGKGYHQLGAGINGTLLFHRDGLTLSPDSGTTMALVEARRAKGATLPQVQGARIDGQGFALVTYLRPYRVNRIDIDPKGSPEDIVFDSTSTQIVPYEGSIVRVKFNTHIEKNSAFHVTQKNGIPLPFGADVVSENNESIGVVGQGSTLLIHRDNIKKAIVKWVDNQCIIYFASTLSEEMVCQ